MRMRFDPKARSDPAAGRSGMLRSCLDCARSPRLIVQRKPWIRSHCRDSVGESQRVVRSKLFKAQSARNTDGRGVRHKRAPLRQQPSLQGFLCCDRGYRPPKSAASDDRCSDEAQMGNCPTPDLVRRSGCQLVLIEATEDGLPRQAIDATDLPVRPTHSRQFRDPAVIIARQSPRRIVFDGSEAPTVGVTDITWADDALQL